MFRPKSSHARRGVSRGRRCGSGDARSLGFDGLFEVAREFDVSVEAVLWQMNFIYNIPGDEIRGCVNHIRGRIGFWDQRYSDKPSERPLRFLALARQAFRKGLVSTGRYAEYAGISRRDAMKVIKRTPRTMPRLKLLILDANEVILLHEFGIWSRFTESCGGPRCKDSRRGRSSVL